MVTHSQRESVYGVSKGNSIFLPMALLSLDFVKKGSLKKASFRFSMRVSFNCFLEKIYFIFNMLYDIFLSLQFK